jgi:hypothetical protein
MHNKNKYADEQNQPGRICIAALVLKNHGIQKP